MSVELIHPIARRWLEDARTDPDAFWDKAAQAIPWFERWDSVFEWTPPTFRWFSGGKTNLAWNALDHHVEAGRGGHAALVGVNERAERRVFTYAQLLHEVERVAAALRGMGIEKGDRLTIYMPTVPEAIIAMLATVRIGAIHVAVFAGFGAGALGDRIAASGSRLVLTADITFRKGKEIRLKEIVDAALQGTATSVEHVVVLRRGPSAPPMKPQRDIGWDEFLGRGQGQSAEHVPMESNEPAFILATSGTTARPKLAVHTHGGY
jgi:acetyl-CoA synthetase